MALFAIQRFMGDEEEEIEENNPTKASHILEKLRKEALARKKKKHSNQNSDQSPKTADISQKSLTQVSFISRKHELKNKKEKRLSSSENDSSHSRQISQNGNKSVAVVTGESQKSPKKKRKHSQSLTEDCENAGNLVSMSSPEKQTSLDVSKDNVCMDSPRSGKKRKQSDDFEDDVNRSKPKQTIDKKITKSKKKTKKSVEDDDDDITKEKESFEKTVDDSSSESEDDHPDDDDDSLNESDKDDKNNLTQDNSLSNLTSQDNDLVYDSKKEGPREIGGFTVLGNYKKKHVEKVKRVLPDWLANPDVIGADLKSCQVPVSSFTRLHPVLLDNLSKNGITHFFPVQAQVIPVLLDMIRHGIRVGPGGYHPSDICVSASTGSGKTLAFVLPIIQALKDCVVRKIRAVAVLPVRDLATQVHKVFQTYCQGTNLKVGLLVGQKTFEAEQTMLVKKRQFGFQTLVDIVVTTPGRLVDHINKTPGFDLTHLRFLVIDEADRMIDDIKQDWIQTLQNAVYQTDSTTWGSCSREKSGAITVASSLKNEIPLQKLLFSATLSQNPEKLQQLNLFQPKLFTSVIKTDSGDDRSNVTSDTTKSSKDTSGNFVGKYITPKGLTEYFVESSKAERPLLILHFLHTLKFRQVLCFTNSVETTHRLYLLIKLVGGVEVREFSSGLHAIRRNKILKKFSAGQIDIIICSDSMARGMDVDNVKYVISYESPPFIKTYIHRVGRTARAGKTGTAFTLLEQKEIFHFKKMLKDAGKTGVKEMKIGRRVLKPHIPGYKKALEQLPEIIQSEKSMKNK